MKNILLIYEKMSPSVRLCAYEQLKWLSENGFFYFQAVQTKHLKNRDLNQCDILFVVRASMWKEMKIVKQIKQSGRKVIYVLDDDLLHVPESSQMFRYYHQKSVRKRIGEILKESDMILTPSVQIKRKYDRDRREIHIIKEPCMNFDKNSILHKKDGKIRIGFAASSDRSKDSESFLKEVLTELQKKYGDEIFIEFMGAKPSFIQDMGIPFLPYIESYEQYIKILTERNWDIGLAPLPEGEFYQCKYYNKYLEYGRQGTIGIFSNVMPYKEVIMDGKNGVLCSNHSDDWVARISELIEDRKKRLAMKEQMIQDIEQNYQIAQVAKEFYKTFSYLESGGKKRKGILFIQWIKWWDIVIRGIEYLERKFCKRNSRVCLKNFV